MRFDLTAMTRRARNPRRAINIRTIAPTKVAADQLAALYVQVVRAISETARDRLLPAYQRALDRMVANDSLVRDDVSQVEVEQAGIEETIRRLVINLTPEMRRMIVRLEETHRSKWAAGVLSATSVDLSTMLGAEDVRDTLEVFLARNVALVRDVAAQARGRIADAVFRGLQARSPARDVAREINNAVRLGRERSLRIAADQATKLSAGLDAERQRQAGLTEWIWRSSHKLHFRPEHQARDGVVYTDATAPEDLPGMLPNCGCRRQAHISFDD